MSSMSNKNKTYGNVTEDSRVYKLNKRKSFVDSLLPAPLPTIPLTSDPTDSGIGAEPWMPATFTVFKALLSARLCAAIWSNVSDCDEVYNYWEPIHYMLHGNGFQTWEYSPVYAIRSYAYLWLHVMPLKVYAEVFLVNRVAQFYFLRCLMALLCTACEVYFYRGICHYFGANIGRITAVLLVFSSGMFISSTAFLPSSSAMYMTMLAMSAWYKEHHGLAILAIAASAIVVWPFTAALGLPIAFDVLFLQMKWKFFLKWCFGALLLFLVPLSQIDSHYYGTMVITPLNIIFYNMFTAHGANLYGVEPWYFYFINGFLNFNIIFFIALIALPVTLLPRYGSRYTHNKRLQAAHALCPMYIWLLVFLPMQHKEERFLFPIYPLICLTSAFVVDYGQRLYSWFVLKRCHFCHYTEGTNWLSLVIVFVYSVLCVSRMMALFYAYHAPLEVYGELTVISDNATLHTLSPDKHVNLCVGKEWYRYPSSFFLPSDKWHLQFVESEFRGQLPQPFKTGLEGTWSVPENMNDENKQERSRFIDLSRCHYLIDLDTDITTDLEPRYSLYAKDWTVIYSSRFLDVQRSNRVLRAFFVPLLSERYTQYNRYVLLQHTRLKRKTL